MEAVLTSVIAVVVVIATIAALAAVMAVVASIGLGICAVAELAIAASAR